MIKVSFKSISSYPNTSDLCAPLGHPDVGIVFSAFPSLPNFHFSLSLRKKGPVRKRNRSVPFDLFSNGKHCPSLQSQLLITGVNNIILSIRYLSYKWNLDFISQTTK